jgi:hypothetical protein
MPILETFSLALLAALTWLWMDSLKAREACIPAARRACEAEGLLFLDETVAIDSIWPDRNDDGRLALRRVYRFEYSETGNDRRKGSITLQGHKVVAFYIRPRLMPLEQSGH